MRQETNTARSARVEHLGHTGRSDPVFEHSGEQGPGQDHPGLS